MAKSIVGSLVGRRGIVYAPVNRAGVLFLFSRLLDEFDMLVEEISPDCRYVVSRRRVNAADSGQISGDDFWERVRIAIAYRSSEFQKNSFAEDDLLICWYHDWRACPLETFELKALFEESGAAGRPQTTVNEGMAEKPPAIPDVGSPESGELLLNRKAVQKRFEKAIDELDRKIKKSFPRS